MTEPTQTNTKTIDTSPQSAVVAEPKIADLEREILRLSDELQNLAVFIADLEESHAWQMRSRCDSEAHAISDASILRQTLAQVYASTSWRITAPLRALMMLARKLRNRHRDALSSTVDHASYPDGHEDAQAVLEPDPQVLGAWSALLYRHAARSREGR